MSDDARLRVLVIMAHPDDVDFWAGGTVAWWVADGALVTYLLVTSGDAGGFDQTPREQMAELRRGEQGQAAALVGVSDVRFLDGYRDGAVEVNDALVRDLCRVIRLLRPDRVLAQSPARTWADVPASHPDHLAVGEAVARAVYPFARNRFAFPELAAQGLEAWTVRELWLQGDPAPDRAVDVTEVFDVRAEALLAHLSQHPDPAATRAKLRADLAANARHFALPEGRLAEVFRVAIID